MQTQRHARPALTAAWQAALLAPVVVVAVKEGCGRGGGEGGTCRPNEGRHLKLSLAFQWRQK